jgi:hypothetical protein
MTVTFSKQVEVLYEGKPLVYESGKTYTAGSGFEQAVFRTVLTDGRAEQAKDKQVKSNKVLSPKSIK